ncbi:MAG: ABC-F family ATP-binding cassette domain-containing protein [Oscillospiraceae bacterium]|jgi:ATPase subunit of ABC transporter with duplicated ATPase domains|nr:ABC-F family ATP-binding cassette domain-containing protein [Oscillospiraceae bacterium]MBR7190239.1 ABC-F family ATP-binding cassette domain-containing protein [Oscillospiraceae bacterium]
MIDISIRNLTKAFEVKKNILDGLTFQVQHGERVGILGRNGAGKTTLFRLMTGEITEDRGDIDIARGKRLGLVSQIPRYPEGYTVEDVLATADARLDAMQQRMRELEKLMSVSDDRAILGEYDDLMNRFEMLGGYDAEVRRAKVANGLDIPPAMREQLFDSLSGGEKTRVNLARLILEDTDILLLDEPTNHLDMRATEWLEDYLLRFKGTVLAISHDRWFLDTVAQRIVEIVDGKAVLYNGNYSFYVEEKRRRYEEALKQYEKNQKEIAHLQKAADDLHLWAFMGNDKLHKRAFSMEKRIERLQKAERPAEEKKLSVRFREKEFFGDEVLWLSEVSKSYGDRVLFSDVELLIEAGERIALVGDNGTGKSTLLKCITGEETPDTGWIREGPSVKDAYLPQLVSFDDPERDMVETMLWEAGCDHQTARDRLAAFGFRGEDVFKTVSVLSGGEQSRLRLCVLMRGDINFLMLDEPTNHLDLISREWMEDALSDYGEALLFVSHDRWFIEKFATRIWYLHNGRIEDFKGGFAAWREFEKRRESLEQTKKAAAREKAPRRRTEPNRDRQRSRVEREIEKAEAAIAALEAEMAESAADYVKLMELEQKKAEADTALEELYIRWEELSD